MIKRIFDFSLAAIGLVALAPLFLPLAGMIKLEDGGPIFYRGMRVGRFGKPFYIIKFRTMLVNAERLGGTSTPEDDARVTGVGKFLRKYKLDELPQLINILKGDMSLVGPRPQVQWAVELYRKEETALLNVRPGITDFASIKFSNEAEILRGSADPDKDYLEIIAPEKIRLGLEYVRSHNFWVDMQIIVATLWVLLGRDAQNILTIPESTGSRVKSPHDGETF